MNHNSTDEFVSNCEENKKNEGNKEQKFCRMDNIDVHLAKWRHKTEKRNRVIT